VLKNDTPLLFLIYINDLCKCTGSDFKLFADDTAILISSTNYQELLSLANQTIADVYKWLQVNKLTLNLQKTSCMMFHAKKTRDLVWTPNIEVDGIKLSFTSSIKYLGFYLDDKLSYKSHLKHLVTKLRRWVGIFRKVSILLPKSAKYSLYNAMFHSNILYAVELYGHANKTDLDSLQKIQNMALKALFHLDKFTPTTLLYSQLDVKNIDTLLKIRAPLLIHTLLKQENDLNITQLIGKYHELMSHKYSTRGKDNIKLHFNKVSFTSSTCFRMPIMWNNIPPWIKAIESKSSFRAEIHNLFSHGSLKPSND